MKTKSKLIIFISLALGLAIVNTYLSVSVFSNFYYERFSDILIISLAFILASLNLFQARIEKKYQFYYFLFSLLFLMILTTHFLRLIFGGLLC